MRAGSAVLFFVTLVFISCKQGYKSTGGNTDTKTSDTANNGQSQHPVTGNYEKHINSQYEYAYADGGRLLIQNSFPRSTIHYSDPKGEQYTYAVFFTRLINETALPFELKIDFPADSFQLNPASGNYMKLLLPPDTMTTAKLALPDYGLELKSFLDHHRNDPSTLRRTIGPMDSGAFYVVTLTHRITANSGTAGILRPGLSLKGQDLYYTVKVLEPDKTFRELFSKEIPCGSINFIIQH